MRNDEKAAVRLRRRLVGIGLGSAVAVGGLVTLAPAAAASAGSEGFNQPGNMVIADQFNNRIVEIDGHQVVWQFGNGSSVAGPNSSETVTSSRSTATPVSPGPGRTS